MVKEDEVFLCSELVRITAGPRRDFGNLEQISPHGCTVSMDEPLPIGQEVRMCCLACPLGKKSCTECRFRGRVRSSENDPVLGCILQVDFEGRSWSDKEWRPRHLTDVETVQDCEG